MTSLRLNPILCSAVALFCLLCVPAKGVCSELIVSAAASLTDAFHDIEEAFEAEHPGVDVVLNLASSGALYRQIEQGAPVDVYASANPKWMDKAVSAGMIDSKAVAIFARNALVLAVPAANPAMVTGVGDLQRKQVVSVAIGNPRTVPAGQYAKQALEKQRLFALLEPKFIYGESVRQVLDYLLRNEVDSGFIYSTDAVRAGSAVKVIAEVPLEKPVLYPIAVLKQPANSGVLAEAFVAFVKGPKGNSLLYARGFSRSE